MLRPERMQKVRIFTLRSIIPELIAQLHKAGLLEIKTEEFIGLEEGRPLEFFNVVSEHLVKARSINVMLEKHATKKKLTEPKLIEINDAIKQSRELGIEEKLKSLTAQISSKESEISRLKQRLDLVNMLLPFKGIDFSKLTTKTISYRVGQYPSEKLNNLKSVLDKELDVYNLSSPEASPVTLLLFQKTEKNIDQILTSAGFSILEIPPEITIPVQSKRQIESSLKKEEAELNQSKKQLVELSDSHIQKIKDLIYSLKIEADRAEITSKFGFSKSMATFEGWIMEKQFAELENVVGNFKDSAMLENVDIKHDEEPPMVFKNPKIASPVEFLTQNYSMPNYFEIDPTMIYLITVPLLLGMIVGDVIYGIVTIFFSMWLTKKFKDSYLMSNVSKLWLYTGFTTILFGLIFNEWAGFILPFYEGFSRLHNLSLLIGITVLVGLVHLVLGFILGAINEWEHNKKHAFAKISWIGIAIGGTVTVASLILNILPEIYGMVGGAVLGISVVGLALTEGLIGILEIPGLMGNMLSYARIAAIGVVGVVLAEIINHSFAPTLDKGILLIVMIPLFVGFHFVNMIVADFEALVQGARLNLIEFRSKFMKGGGRLFEPFALRSQNK
jgi:V/A-type H+-transporting ATPase subunit I